MSVREFAAHLGVSDRMVSKWERGGMAVRPRPSNQAALDTSLRRATPTEQARFADALSSDAFRSLGQEIAGPGLVRVATSLFRHPDDAKLMTLVSGGFFIDVFATTNRDYQRFVTATGHEPPPSWRDNTPPAGLDDHPVVGVSWFDAAAYARWAGKALPTGWQWEAAARGADGSVFPWGPDPSPRDSNVRETRVGTTTPVGWFDRGVSGCGAYDLCGNVWHWCATPAGPHHWQVRGGAFTARAAASIPTGWQTRVGSGSFDDVGFRCVTPVSTVVELLTF